MSRAVAALAVVVLGATVAGAHERSASWSSWRLSPEGAEVTVRLGAREATRLGARAEDPERLGRYLATHVRLLAGEAPCAPVGAPAAERAAPGEVAFRWRVACGAGARRIRSDALLGVAPAHLHFARVRGADAAPLEAVLSDGEREVALGAPAPPSITAAVRLGVAHILSGWDHLAFVVALLLVAGTFAETVRVVTGFTVAHSVTLALATLGWVRPAQAPVEALIGLSIALVAVENAWLAGRRRAGVPWLVAMLLAGLAAIAAAGGGRVPALALAGLAVFAGCHMSRLARSPRPLGLRWHTAFAFGLLHGFGFASVLVDGALPPAALARVLIGFNAGVEVGQVAVVAAVLPLLAWVRVRRPVALEVGSGAVAGLGVFWFVTRAYG